MARRIADSKAPGTTKKACRTSVGVRWMSFSMIMAAGAISGYSIARKVCMAVRRPFRFWFLLSKEERYSGISPVVMPTTI